MGQFYSRTTAKSGSVLDARQHSAIFDALILDRQRFLELMRDVEFERHLDSGIYQVQNHVSEPDVGGRFPGGSTLVESYMIFM